jgi:carboxyl-terminal processing protease
MRPAPELADMPRPSAAPLAYLDGTLVTLASKYVDPNRFDFRHMLRGALDGMEEDVAEVIAESANDQVTVRVDQDSHTFAGDVDSLSELGIRLTEIIRFVEDHANPTTERSEIELAAVNGMLGTLDPHTFVIPAKDMEDWNVNLTGKFGGLGIVIGMRNDRVTALKVHANTPAEKGGMQVGDQIVEINGQSTEALTLDEAMSRLRGDPGSLVTIGVDRAGTKIDLPLTRAEIKIPVVESRMLDGNVGYVFLDRFDAETAKELERAMEALRDRGAKGWVIDLRQNSGGYLSQAVKAADLFVEYGTIVATVAGGKKHDVKNATSGGIDTRKPVVVLIGDQTASSAEILAGALKQLDRATLVGRRTFGKGSVQVLEDAAHGAKLKITTAEYVAANDISPQGGGIAPDIELIPAKVPAKITEEDAVRLVPEEPFREVDLGAHLSTAQKQDPDKPLATIHYRWIDTNDDPTKDFEVKFARDFVLAAKRTRKESAKLIPKFVKAAQAAAEADVLKAFTALGVDWHAGKPTSKLVATLPATLAATAGGLVTLEGDVTNQGVAPAFRVHVRTTSADPSLDGIELAFGKIDAHQTKHAKAIVRLPKGSASRTSLVTWKITDVPVEGALQVAITGTPFPAFTLAAQLADGNDGIARAGETLHVKVHVTNRGPGKSSKPVATLKSLVGERLIVDRGRTEIGALDPNQSKDIDLAFASKKDLDLNAIALEVSVTDGNVGATQTQRLDITLGKPVADAHWDLSPPIVRVDSVPLETTSDRVRITGNAEDEQVVRDLYVTTSNRGAKVDERKVYYAAGRSKKLDFTAEVPLALGINRVLVIARERDASHTVKTLWVLRR